MGVKVAITGRPGIGKTTVFSRVVEMLRTSGLTIDGFMCPEVRIRGRRVGFDLLDIKTGERVALSRICALAAGREVVGRVGKYCVFREAGSLGCSILRRALGAADVIGIDEVGPMELMISELRSCIYGVLREDDVNALLVIHRRVVRDVKRSLGEHLRIFWVDESNRDSLPSVIYDILTKAVSVGN